MYFPANYIETHEKDERFQDKKNKKKSKYAYEKKYININIYYF